MSQKALADKIGMTQQAVALLENGKRKVEFDLFVRIMEILGEPIADIATDGSGHRTFSNPDDFFEYIIKAYGGCVSLDDTGPLYY